MEQGTHDDLLRLNGMYAKLVARQLSQGSKECSSTTAVSPADH